MAMGMMGMQQRPTGSGSAATGGSKAPFAKSFKALFNDTIDNTGDPQQALLNTMMMGRQTGMIPPGKGQPQGGLSQANVANTGMDNNPVIRLLLALQGQQGGGGR